VTAGAEVTILMRRVNRLGKVGVKVHAPKYGKPMDERWLVVVGNPDTRELAALKETVLECSYKAKCFCHYLWVKTQQLHKEVGAVRVSTTFSETVSPMEVGRML
jgi:hypothetical protein